MKFGLFMSARRVVLGVFALLSASAAHFLGFLNNFPEGFQRLVATSFGVEFTAIFLYYVALATIGARLGGYVAYAWRSVITLITRGWRVRSEPGARAYLKSALKIRNLIELIPWIVFPVLLAASYVSVSWLLKTLPYMLVVIVLLIPVRLPLLVVSPTRFWERLWSAEAADRRPTANQHVSMALAFLPARFAGRVWSSKLARFKLDYGGEIFLISAFTFVALAYFLGEARFARLAQAPTTYFETQTYRGQVVILAQANGSTLALERAPSGVDKRFILIGKDFIASETDPPKSESFPPLRTRAQSEK